MDVPVCGTARTPDLRTEIQKVGGSNLSGRTHNKLVYTALCRGGIMSATNPGAGGPQSRTVRFGVFEFDLESHALSKHGIRLRIQDQPAAILAALVSHPGQLVSRDELRELLWPDGTFVDFDQSLNKAVNKVRDTLGDSADTPRYIETVPRRGYRFIAPVSVCHGSPVVTSPAEQAPATPARPFRGVSVRAAIIIAAVGLLIAIAAVLARARRNSAMPVQHAIRMTTDGNSIQPTLSPDGKLLAYASSGSGGASHIWVRQTAGGDPLQITNGTGGESEPNFSPDGTKIAFRSETDAGGVYVIPTFGGEPRLLATAGLSPRFSPDGGHLWYLAPVDFGLKGFLVPVQGGTPEALPQRLWVLHGPIGYQSTPIWAPPGDRFLYFGADAGSKKSPPVWRVALIHGNSSRPVKIPGWDGRQENAPLVHTWTRTGAGAQSIIYSDRTGDSLNLFRVALSESYEITGKPEQLTSGAGLIPNASASQDGKVAFASVSLTEGMITIAPDGPNGAGALLERSAGLRNRSPSVSRDGRWLAYAATDFYGRAASIRLRDLLNGTDRSLIDSVVPSDRDFISISPDASKVVFGQLADDARGQRVCSAISAAGGTPERISSDCAAPRGFTSDGSELLIQRYHADGPDEVIAVDLRSKRERRFLYSGRMQLWHAFFSWDDRWVVFKTAEAWNRSQILIAPLRGELPAPESEWIKVTDGRRNDDKPQFSPDGKRIYFTSDRDGYHCLWAQQLDAAKHPDGSPYPIRHFHSSMGWYLKSYQPWDVVVSVARGKIVTNFIEAHADIWMSQLN
jgi:Tol biopolymer transport system component/DNA-binding winged helix-turn-helix (wHTH) protein